MNRDQRQIGRLARAALLVGVTLVATGILVAQSEHVVVTPGWIRTTLGLRANVPVGIGTTPVANTSLATAAPILAATGTAGAPAFSFGIDPDTGFYAAGGGYVNLSGNGTRVILFAPPSGQTGGGFRIYTAHGAYWEHNSVSEAITIGAAASTDSTANLLPAGSIIEAVVVRVTTVIPTAATFKVGDASDDDRFATGIAVAAGTTGIGILHAGTTGVQQAANAKVRITPNLAPAAGTGVVRVTVFYRLFVAPTA